MGRTIFTTITPLGVMPREVVLEGLQDHFLMIDLNPLVEERHKIGPPKKASPEEYHCKWYSITDKVSIFPGVKGKVTYSACFHDLSNGIQTHVYAPLGVDIRSKWLVGGTLPGEPLETVELGLNIPKEGLYIREDVDLTCSPLVKGTVMKNLKTAHETLKGRLAERTHIKNRTVHNDRLAAMQGQQNLGSHPSTSQSSLGLDNRTGTPGPFPAGGVSRTASVLSQNSINQPSPHLPPNPPFDPRFSMGFPPQQFNDPRLSTSSQGSGGIPQPLGSPGQPGSGGTAVDPAYAQANPYGQQNPYAQQQMQNPYLQNPYGQPNFYGYPPGAFPYPYAPGAFPPVGPGGVPIHPGQLPPGYPASTIPNVVMELSGDQNYYQGQQEKGIQKPGDQKGQVPQHQQQQQQPVKPPTSPSGPVELA